MCSLEKVLETHSEFVPTVTRTSPWKPPFNIHLSPGRYWRSVQRYSPWLGLSLLEAKRGDLEEAEAVSAMASLSVANTNAAEQR